MFFLFMFIVILTFLSGSLIYIIGAEKEKEKEKAEKLKIREKEENFKFLEQKILDRILPNHQKNYTQSIILYDFPYERKSPMNLDQFYSTNDLKDIDLINRIQNRYKKFLEFDENEVVEVFTQYLRKAKLTTSFLSYKIKYESETKTCIISYKFDNINLIYKKMDPNKYNLSFYNTIDNQYISEIYEKYIFGFALEIITLAFNFNESYIENVLFNGYISDEKYTILSVLANITDFKKIDLSCFEHPRQCFQTLEMNCISDFSSTFQHIVPLKTSGQKKVAQEEEEQRKKAIESKKIEYAIFEDIIYNTRDSNITVNNLKSTLRNLNLQENMIYSNVQEHLRKKFVNTIDLRYSESKICTIQYNFDDVSMVKFYISKLFNANTKSPAYKNYKSKGFDSIYMGADIIAFKNGVKFAIQCKKYSQQVGVNTVKEVLASKEMYRCHVGVVLTNNTFTSQAIQLAKSNNILLWDGKELEKLQST